MHTEPIAYTVGDAILRIDDVIPIGSTDVVDDPVSSRRIYTFRVTKHGMTTVWRCKVKLADIIRLTDQQLAEYLLAHGRRKLRLFGFFGDSVP